MEKGSKACECTPYNAIPYPHARSPVQPQQPYTDDRPLPSSLPISALPSIGSLVAAAEAADSAPVTTTAAARGPPRWQPRRATTTGQESSPLLAQE